MGWFWADSASVVTDAVKLSASSAAAPAKCPVDHKKFQGGADGQSSDSKCPVNHKQQSSWFGSTKAVETVSDRPQSSESKCPVNHKQRSSWFGSGKSAETVAAGPQGPDADNNNLNPLNNMPELSSARAPGQRIYLPTERTLSSIPRGVDSSAGVWEYPSPQQMFNAMLRKGGGEIPEDAVESMVDVHNFLNEGAWQEILKWESPYTKSSEIEPRLLKFTGRPDEPSPRARLIQLLGSVYPSKYGTPPPFDRHDWTVLRYDATGNSEEVRYVIDYYSGPDDNGSPTFILDVRPALDSVSNTLARLHRSTDCVWDKAMGSNKRYPGQE